MPKEYLLAPNFDLPPPPSGPLQLGHILDDPTEPRYPLNPDDVIAPLDSKSYTQAVTGFSATRSQLHESGFRLWAKLTDLVPVGADAGVIGKKDSTDVYSIKTIDTEFFLPSKKYLEASVHRPDVKRFLEGSRWRNSIFMITGLKVARGASVTSYRLSEQKAGGEASVNLAPVTVPLSIGAGGGRNITAEELTKTDGSGDFVLAYQLRKIIYKKGKPAKHESYNKGAVFDNDPVRGAQGDDGLVVDGLEEEEVVPEAAAVGDSWSSVSNDKSAGIDERIWFPQD
jgi:hypothetical protein